MKYQYLFSDMDGTLLNDSGLISALNLNAIHAFIDAGGYFTVATGRSEVITKPYLETLKLNFPAILYNGAAIFDFRTNQFLYKKRLANSVVAAIIQTALELYPDICIEAFTEGPIKLLNPDGMDDHLMVRENQPFVCSTYKTTDEYMKLLLYGEHEKLLEIGKTIAPLSKNQFTAIFSAPFYLEILPADCSKGSALSWMMEHFSIPKQSVAAIGDYDNDLEMLKTAALSAAPNNALERVKASADIIVADHNHDAVAAFIHHYIL